jgi:hypothetical protein
MNMKGSADIQYDVDHAGGFAARIGRDSGAATGGIPVPLATPPALNLG